MERFGGNEVLQQRQKRLSISGQLSQKTNTKSEDDNGATSLTKKSESKAGPRHISTQRAETQRRPPPPPPQNRGNTSNSLFRGKRQASENTMYQRNSNTTAATIRATCHQLAETLKIFGKQYCSYWNYF